MDREYVRRIKIAEKAASDFCDMVQKTGNIRMLGNDSEIVELYFKAFDVATDASEEEKDFYFHITDHFLYKSLLLIHSDEFAKEMRGRKTITVKELNALCQPWVEYIDDAIERNDRNKPEYEAEKADNIKEFIAELKKLGITVQTGGCYIATAVYGSYDCPQVWILRRYRDNVLAANILGRTFIRTYYSISPYLVKRFSDSKWFIRLWKNQLDAFVQKLQKAGYADTPYTDPTLQDADEQ